MDSLISLIRYKNIFISEVIPLITIIGYFLLFRIKALFSSNAKSLYQESNCKQSFLFVPVIIFYLFICIILYMEFDRMITNGSDVFFRNRRWCFYLVLCCVFILVSILLIHFPKLLYLIVFEIAAILIITDLKLSIIDEGAHVEIIQYILNSHHFPTVGENYEAVQGPVYYYLMVLLIGWIPEKYQYIGCRFFGLACLFAFGYLIKKLINLLKEKKVITCPPDLINIIWLLFVLSPHIMIRFTRASNEALMCVMSAFVILKITEVLLVRFDKKTVLICTITCAFAFLTKSTSVFLFGLIILSCIYYKQWQFLLWQLLIYLLIVSPWFISNYITYGALTAMEGHLAFVMHIVNPQMIRPDILQTFLGIFSCYFLNPESGVWYDYSFFDKFINAFILISLTVYSVITLKLIIEFIGRKLNFKYSEAERKQYVVISYSSLFIAAIIMHTVQTLITYNNSLGCNRYYFMINGAFCGLFLIGMSDLSEHKKLIIRHINCFYYAFVILSMVCGYIEKITLGI